MEIETDLERYVEDYLDSNFDGEYTDVEVNQVLGGADISLSL